MIRFCLAVQFTCFCLFSFQTFAQKELRVKVEKEPAEYLSYINKRPDHGIKQLISINTYNKARPGQIDTLSVEDYDVKGNKIKVSRYDDNKKTALTTLENSADKRTSGWQLLTLKNQSLTISKSVHTSFGKEESFRNWYLFKGDTVNRESGRWTYNIRNQLIKKENFGNGKLVFYETYEYSGTDMVRAQIHTGGDVNYFTRYDYKFDANHLPAEKRVYMIRNGTIDPSAYTYFVNSGNNLIEERYPAFRNKGSQVTVKYSYDEQNRISSVRAKSDTLYMDIDYTYKGSRLVRINARSNELEGFNKELFVYYSGSGLVKPSFYLKEFFYDERDNLIRQKESFNGILQRESVNQLTYWSF